MDDKIISQDPLQELNSLQVEVKKNLLGYLKIVISEVTIQDELERTTLNILINRLTTSPDDISTLTLTKILEILQRYKSEKSIGLLNILKQQVPIIQHHIVETPKEQQEEKTVPKEKVLETKNVLDFMETLHQNAIKNDAKIISEGEIVSEQQ